MQLEKIRGKVGSPVTGPDEFFDREREFAKVMGKINRGDSVYLSAPRRIGKTSLMHKLMIGLQEAGHTCFFFSMERYTSPSEWIADWFVKAILGKGLTLPEKALMGLKKIISGMGTSDSVSEVFLKGLFDTSNWRRAGDELFDTLASACEEGTRVVVFLDELAVLIEYLVAEDGKPELFLSWLRSIQQKHHKKLSIVIASSIGLYPLLNKLGLNDRMNAFLTVPIDAWDQETAIRCIHALARGYSLDIDSETPNRIVNLIGWCSPMYVQLFMDILADERLGGTCTCNDAERIYSEKIVRGQTGNYQLSPMEERLRKIFNEREYAQAMQWLSLLSASDHPVSSSELTAHAKVKGYYVDAVSNILLNLEHDGYIEGSRQGWVFRSKLLKDWWKNRYGDQA